MRKWILSGATLCLAPWFAHASDQCVALAKFEMANVSITSATSQPAGTFTSEAGQKIPGLPAFCRVVGVATPTPQSKVGFEVWLPEQNWSGRYVQAGNGGLAGIIFHPLLAQLLQRGHATASTDNGHQAIPIDGTWAIGQPEKVRDFAERAVHVTSDIAKAVVARFYQKKADRSYFYGCSEGGREALIAAQRYPEAFDGIVAGAPASHWTNLMTSFVWRGQALHGTKEGYIPESKLPFIQAAAMKACDAKDGVEDGLVSDLSCRFNPRELECKGAESDQCLTGAQVSSLERLYGDLRDPKTNVLIAPGYVPSGENETGPIGGGVRQYAFGAAPGQSLQVAFSTGYFGGFVFERRDWDFRTFDLTRDLPTARQKLGALMDATNPDLTKLRKSGGKLIQ
ncbi:tannase/feruloyl esterase family alpha/beta hydrolase, partial [Steroidobacter sp.]|uniref:tannase/feruloyl esterase family alpha/beta hydrolase n=1 Tax=Steroidobacter sp. TaxID=1978227 RepID=UPI001A6066A9